MLFDSGRLTGAQCYDMTNTSQQRQKESSWPAVVIFQPTASHVEKRHLFPSSIPMLMYVDARREGASGRVDHFFRFRLVERGHVG